MKAEKKLRNICLAIAGCFAFTGAANAQEVKPAPEIKTVRIEKSEPKPAATIPAEKTPIEKTPAVKSEQSPSLPETEKKPENEITDVGKSLPQDVPEELKANRRGQMSEEEAAIIPYYNNFMSNYYLGPEDVISVEVFQQCPSYCKPGITVPPTGRISYPLIREGIVVNGKTVEQVADEITKKLDEYIIDPKVMVTLERAVSARYSVLGDVGSPGVRTMTRRLSVHEALAEAGGVLRTGNRKQIVVLRRGADGRPQPIAVNLQDIERGKAKEQVFLVPGDQVIVPGNKIKTLDRVLNLLPIIGFARMFAGF